MLKKREEKILVSWAGNSDVMAMDLWRIASGFERVSTLDLRGADKDEKKLARALSDAPGDSGPLRTFCDDQDAELIYVLLSKQFEECGEALAEWVGRRCKARCVLVPTHLDNPSEYALVYDATAAFFREHWRGEYSERMEVNLTSGTPAMQTIMMLLSKTHYPCKTIRVVQPHEAVNGVQRFEEHLPFELPVEALRRQSSASLAEGNEVDELMRVYVPFRQVNILLTGPSGVGKSRLAHEIHQKQQLKEDSFVTINCAELAGGDENMFRSELFGHVKGAYTGATTNREGAFKQASGGTLFLDEIGELPPERQAMLLRVLQERRYTPLGSSKDEQVEDVRLICATNRDLEAMVQQGTFRADLYYRIAMYTLRIKSLHEIACADEKRFWNLVDETIEQIKEEVSQFKEQDFALSEQAREVMLSYDWPGNARELHHTLLLAMIEVFHSHQTLLDASHLERHVMGSRLVGSGADAEKESISEESDWVPANLEKWLEDKQYKYVTNALHRSNNKVAKAAKLLGMSYQTLYYYLKSHPELQG